MRFYRRIVILGALLCPLSFAEENLREKAVAVKFTAAYNQCTKREVSTPGMIECATAELKIHDARLNHAYKALMAGFGTEEPKRAAALRAAQKLWIQFRDAECTYQASESEGGSMQPLAFAQCQLTMTIERATELQRQLDPPK